MLVSQGRNYPCYQEIICFEPEFRINEENIKLLLKLNH